MFLKEFLCVGMCQGLTGLGAGRTHTLLLRPPQCPLPALCLVRLCQGNGSQPRGPCLLPLSTPGPAQKDQCLSWCPRPPVLPTSLPLCTRVLAMIHLTHLALCQPQ